MSEETRYRNYILQKVQSSLNLCYDNKYSEDITLNIDNIGPLLTSLGIKQGETEILDLTRNALIDTNGCIDPLKLEEALVNVSLENGDDEEAFFEEAFTIIDLDNDGYITAPDIYRLFQKLNIGITDEGLITLLKNLDYDRDGTIDFEDFRSLMLGLKFQEPQIEHNCDDDDDDEDAEDAEDDDDANLRLNIEALRERRPSLRKLTKEDSQFHLVSEKKRSLFSYAGVVKDTTSVVSYLRRISNTETQEKDIQEIRANEEAISSQLTAPNGRNSRKFSLRSDISRLLPASTNPRRSSLENSPPADTENSNLLQVRSSGTFSGNVSISIKEDTTGEMRQVIPKTVTEKEKDSEQDKFQSGDDDNDLLCLKDLCLTIVDTDRGNDSALTLSQTVNGLVVQASGMANRRNSTEDLDWGAAVGSPSKSPGQQKRQLSVESSANEFRDNNSSVKCPRDNYDPDDMTSATRNNLFEFHKITSKSSHSIEADSTSNDHMPEEIPEEIPQSPQNWNTETPRSKKSDLTPFFPASIPNARGASPRPGCSQTGKENGDDETEDMYVSLVEKYHRPQRRYRRRVSSESATVGKCLKVRSLKKTKSISKAKKDKAQSQEAGTSEIRVPTAGDENDEEEKRLREDRLQSFVTAERKTGYVKIENFEIPLTDSPRTPSVQKPKRSLKNTRPQTARQVRHSYPQQYILGDSVTSKHLSNSMTSPRTLEEHNDIHGGYIVGHISYEKPTINGMQPLKTRKHSAPGVSTWQHEFPTVGTIQSAPRPKTAIGMKRAMLSRSYKYLNRPFTARTAPATRGSNQSERDSMMGSNETLSSHNISDHERKESQTTSKEAQFGESNDSAGYISEDTSDLGNSFGENDFIASRNEKTTTCEAKVTGDEVLSEETRQGYQFVPTSPKEKQDNNLLKPQPIPQKSPYIKRLPTPKSPLLMTRKSYPLGNRDEPLNDDAMPSSRRPQTARTFRRSSIYASQQSYPPDGSSTGYSRVRPTTAVPMRKQSITSTPVSMNVVDMSPCPSRSRPVTARTRDGRKPSYPEADTEDIQGAALEATSGPNTANVITNNFPGSAVRRRKSVTGNMPQPSSKDNEPGSPKIESHFMDGIEGESLTPRGPTASILRRPKSSVGQGFSKQSLATSELSVVDMTEALDDRETVVNTQRRRSFKPITRAIMALNQTRRLVQNSSISRSLETKGILLQHDDLSKTKTVTSECSNQTRRLVQNSSISRSLETKGILLQHDDLSKLKVVTHDAVPVVSGNPLKTKTVITLEIPQI